MTILPIRSSNHKAGILSIGAMNNNCIFLSRQIHRNRESCLSEVAMDLDAMLKDLREKYIRELPDMIESIEVFYAQKNLSLVREEFHKLRGTGKTYGVDEISVLGECVENLCVFFPESAEQLIPFAIRLLSKIHVSRSQNLIFDIHLDADFVKLQKLATKH